MHSFRNDYSEGCHPNIIKALLDTNLEQQEGYGDDQYCQEAKELIKLKIKNQNADIHFVSAGTQANLIVISSILKPFESVISASTGHINVHETGAIEATGHKIETIFSEDGKLNPELIQSILEKFEDHHMTKPKLVYISNSTEVGTFYSKIELVNLSAFCKKNNLYLFMDGARLGSALCASINDLAFSDLSALTDVFYIGGTKNGALLGEAIIINNNNLKEDFKFHLKQRGALLSKGRLLGIQFRELFKENLYLDLASQANSMASILSSEIKNLGFEFLSESKTNQIFPILPNSIITELSKDFGFYVWKKIDNKNAAIRLVTSWATKKEVVEKFINTLKTIQP
ncbi:MAG: low specificity L-threonine aldolase [Bacteroidota bacterium]